MSSEIKKIESKYNLFELFLKRKGDCDDNIKFSGDIKFPILETILFDNGQLYKWIFNSKEGIILKRNSKKLNKDYIMLYFIKEMLIFLKEKEKFIIKKSVNEILSDMNRLNLILERYNRNDSLPEEYEYLHRLINKSFLLPRKIDMTLMYPNDSSYFAVNLNNELITLFELFQLLHDTNKLSMIRMIQSLLYVNLNYHPLICRFYRKSHISQRKIQLYTPFTSIVKDSKLTDLVIKHENNKESKASKSIYENLFKKNTYNSNDGSQIHEKSKKYSQLNSHLLPNMENMIILHNSSLEDSLTRLSQPFINIIESYYNLSLSDGLFRFLKVDDYNYLFFSCERLIFREYEKLPFYESCLPHYCHNKKDEKENMIDRINKENEYYKNKINLRKGYMIVNRDLNNRGILKNNKFPLFGKEKVYEKSVILQCYGEFCEYVIPKHFKGLKILKKDGKKDNEYINEYLEDENKRKSIDFRLSNFILKKIYDNDDIVNILFKAYKIFPPNINKILLKLKEEYMIEESKDFEKIKEKENNKYKSRHHQNNEINQGNLINTFSTNTFTSSYINESNEKDNNKFLAISTNEKRFTQRKNSNIRNSIALGREEYMNKNTIKAISDLNRRSIDKIEKNDLNCSENSKENKLYIPTKDKFLHINSDKLYSEVPVCNNCYIIYSLLDSFINNIKEDNSFINIKKAKVSLSQFQKQVFSSEEVENPNLQYLYKDEKEKFDLKKILKWQIYKEENSIVKSEKRVKPQDKNNHKMFTYKMEINPKIMNFNIAAENKENQFFKVIFDQIHNNKDDLIKHLDIKLDKSVMFKSMSSLRMHMGINSSKEKRIFNSNPEKEGGLKIINNSGGYYINKKYKNDDNNIVNSNDLFKAYKQIKKHQNNSILSVFLMKSRETTKKDLIHVNKENNLIPNEKKDNKDNINDEDNQNIYSDSNSLIYDKDSLSSHSLKINTILNEKIKEIGDESIQNKTQIKHCVNFKELLTNDQYDNLYNKYLNFEEKKVHSQSIFYFNWKKNEEDAKDYYVTTPRTIYNELNIPIYENLLLLTRKINIEEFIKIGFMNEQIGNISKQSLFNTENKSSLNDNYLNNKENILYKDYLDCCVFVFDQFTAVPYKITKVLETKNQEYEKIKFKTEKKSISILAIIVNDFFSSLIEYNDSIDTPIKDAIMGKINKSTKLKDSSIENVKILKFNLPGQPMTIFKNNISQILNNEYYSEFIDRLLFFLYEQKEIDNSYQFVFIGFGNGGYISLTFASLYEKYTNSINSIILVNSYIENDEFLNKSMYEILKIIEKTNDTRLIDFFIKSLTEDPKKLYNLNTVNDLNLSEKHTNNGSICSLYGYLLISKGYFYNISIDIHNISTPIYSIHSNQNCFITINNLNKVFSYLNTNLFTLNTKPLNTIPSLLTNTHRDEKYMNINDSDLNLNMLLFIEILYKTNRRKLVLIEGTHNVLSENRLVLEVIFRKYFQYLFENIKEIISIN